MEIPKHLKQEQFAAGETIIHEGDKGDACYLICSGQVGVVSSDLIGQDAPLATFGPGDLFGEIALVIDGLRTATVVALEPVLAYVLYRSDFTQMEQSLTAFGASMRQHVDLLAIDAFLVNASPFANLPRDTIRQLAGKLSQEQMPVGEIIISQGDEGDKFYLVRRGRVEVLKDNHRVQILESGDCFGEVALLAKVKRTATVRVLEDTELLSLNQDQFTEVVGQYETLQQRFAEFIRIRVGNALARTVAAADPLNTLMPELPGDQRRRYWWFLIGGVAAFAVLSWVATTTKLRVFVRAALVIGSFIGPIVYVIYLAETHLLPDKPLNLVITFLLAAAIGIPLAYVVETWLGVRHGALESSLLVGVIEETAKVVGVVWLLRRATARFQMDGVIYGAAAGMGFAAFETALYGWFRVDDVSTLFSVLWLRAVLSPFGHGTWTAIICAAIWRQRESGAPLWDFHTAGAFALSVGLHTVWDWQPVDGILLIGLLLAVGLVGLEVLRTIVGRANRAVLASVVALNPDLGQAGEQGVRTRCRRCGQMSLPGTRYCPRCANALRVGSS